jgi:hypothetical protein
MVYIELRGIPTLPPFRVRRQLCLCLSMIHLDIVGVTRWEPASKALLSDSNLMNIFLSGSADWDHLVQTRSQNFPDDGLYEMWSSGQTMNYGSIPAFGIATGIYGLLHAAPAWTEFFATSAERLLWKMSALIAGLGFFWGYLLPRLDGRKSSKVYLIELTWILFILFCILAYISARIFLVVEAFISLRILSVDAYKTLAWTQFIPHL